MNCRQNEEKVFPSLLEELDAGFVEARLHTDGPRGEELMDFQEALVHTLARPTYLVVEPRSEKPLSDPLSGTVSVRQFRRYLAGAQEKARADAQARGEEKVGRLDPR